MPYSYHRLKSTASSPNLLAGAFRQRTPWISASLHRKLFVAIAVLLVLISGSLLSLRVRNTLGNFTLHGDTDRRICNETLGFEKIYALSLPERQDRRTEIFAAANLTNLSVVVLDAVRDKEVKGSAKLKNWGKDHREGELGCVTSHLQTWSKMIEENTTSALIIESDADWDVRIRSSMPGLAAAANTLLDYPFPNSYIPQPSLTSNASSRSNSTDHKKRSCNPKELYSSPSIFDTAKSLESSSPYGPDWDILWVGHCGASSPGNARLFTYSDPTASSSSRAHVLKEGLDSPSQKPEGNGTRVVFEFGTATCTAGYAISIQGARKLVEAAFGERSSDKENPRRNKGEPVDKWMARLCQHDVGMRCLGVWPQIISPAMSKSNIGETDKKGGRRRGEKEKDKHQKDGDKKKEDDDRAVWPGKGIQISARVNAYEGRTDEESWRWEWFEE